MKCIPGEPPPGRGGCGGHGRKFPEIRGNVKKTAWYGDPGQGHRIHDRGMEFISQNGGIVADEAHVKGRVVGHQHRSPAKLQKPPQDVYKRQVFVLFNDVRFLM